MSFFNWQDIPQVFLASYQEHGAGIDASEAQEKLYVPQGAVELEKALGVIKAFSFISESEVEDSFNMHRLTQLVMRKWLIVQSKEGQVAKPGIRASFKTIPNWVVRALESMYSIFTTRLKRSNTHAGNDTEHCEQDTDTVARAALQHKVALFMLYQGKWDDAEKF